MGNIIYFAKSGSAKTEWAGGYLRVSNRTNVGTTSTQYVDITYLGYGDYETAHVFDDGRRGYEQQIQACVWSGPGAGGSYITVRVYLTDVSEVNSMSGYVFVYVDGWHYRIGNNVIADFSRIDDREGVNSLSKAWSREACPDYRGLGRWSLNQRVGSANSNSYELTSSDSNQTLSAWAQYRTDAGNYKWACEDVQIEALQPALPEPEPVNALPQVGYGPVYYYVNENSGSGTLSTENNGRTPYMSDWDRETIRYGISIPEGTSSNVASSIRSIFRVRNTAPNPTASDSAQTISISYNRSFNYETTPELDYGRGYKFLCQRM